jgi:hypothetical protein
MKKPKRFGTPPCLIVAVSMLICAGMVYAQSSPDYRIEADVISGGGGEGSSTNYDLFETIG